MTKDKMAEILNRDLVNEYKHMLFYLHSGCVVKGMWRQEVREWLLGEAKSEMLHVQQFADLIAGLGFQPTNPSLHTPDFPHETDAKKILQYALKMEQEVCDNYSRRMEEAEEIGTTWGNRIHVFMENQLEESHQDVDHLQLWVE